MKLFVFLITSFALVLTSCMINSDISNDPRMVPIVGKHVNTKVPLRLYGINFQDTRNRDFYNLTSVDAGSEDLVGFVPVGSRVFFERALIRSGGGVSRESLVGQLKYKGKTYPFTYNLGITDYPNLWRRVYDDFDVSEAEAGTEAEVERRK
jgi:hypothetical protein